MAIEYTSKDKFIIKSKHSINLGNLTNKDDAKNTGSFKKPNPIFSIDLFWFLYFTTISSEFNSFVSVLLPTT